MNRVPTDPKTLVSDPFGPGHGEDPRIGILSTTPSYTTVQKAEDRYGWKYLGRQKSPSFVNR